MKRFRYSSVPAEDVPPPAECVKVRWLITEETGAPNFAMREFTVGPGGSTPRHVHPWEHEVFVLAGKGTVSERVATSLSGPGTSSSFLWTRSTSSGTTATRSLGSSA